MSLHQLDLADPRRPPGRGNGRSGNEDDDLQKAIADSLHMQEDEERRRGRQTQEEDDLAKALRASEDEEARRKRELEASNTKALFDDNLNL